MAESQVGSDCDSPLKNEAGEEFSAGMTMIDVLQEEKQIEDDMKAVLGGSDAQNCTYFKGYIKRQALYSCLTCLPATGKDAKPGGICLACSYFCHEGHDLIELYTKRNFRCDCGNARYPGNKCNLVSDKAQANELNAYNQNFSGTYCTCKRPYPDPEELCPNDEMIQCIMCEDWYHGSHLGTSAPSDDFSEMICQQCVSKHPFIRNYADAKPKSGENEEMLVISDCPSQENTASGCCLPTPSQPAPASGALFMGDNWRKQLCRCAGCTAVYAAEGVSYLLDEDDSVQAYEEKGMASGQAPTLYEQGMQALQSLDRVNQIEALEEYNKMKDQLKDYLQKFADNKKVVREEDIREFFSGMEARKKPRVELPTFCR